MVNRGGKRIGHEKHKKAQKMKFFISLFSAIFLLGLLLFIHSTRVWNTHGYDYWLGSNQTGLTAIAGWFIAVFIMGFSAIALLWKLFLYLAKQRSDVKKPH